GQLREGRVALEQAYGSRPANSANYCDDLSRPPRTSARNAGLPANHPARRTSERSDPHLSTDADGCTGLVRRGRLHSTRRTSGFLFSYRGGTRDSAADGEGGGWGK